MFFRDRQETLDGLAQLGAHLCGYNSGDPETWVNGRCDCKYGGPNPARPFGEQTGCPEVRSTFALVGAMSDIEWNALIQRAGGFNASTLRGSLESEAA